MHYLLSVFFFSLLEETPSQNYKERKTYKYKNKIKYIERIEYNCNDEN